jgi:hypothetical protein
MEYWKVYVESTLKYPTTISEAPCTKRHARRRGLTRALYDAGYFPIGQSELKIGDGPLEPQVK